MGKKKQCNELLNQARDLRNAIKRVNEEIRILDEAIAQMQIDRIEQEENCKENTTPFFFNWFRIHKSKRIGKDEFFGEFQDYHYGCSITLCQAEMVMLKGFKEAKLKQLNEEVDKLSELVNVDTY